MFEIPHQEVQKLLQSAAGQTLAPDDKSAIENHLSKCIECSVYAKNLTNLEVNVRRVLHTQWDSQQPDLDLRAITALASSKFSWSTIFNPAHALGKAIIITSLFLGYFIISNIFGNQVSTPENNLPTTVPTPFNAALELTNSPTPSPSVTVTGRATQECEHLNYVTQAGDTLESIAAQFGVSEDVIAKRNNLKTYVVSPNMEILIPVCANIPSKTAIPPRKTLAIPSLTNTILPDQRE